MGQLRLEPLIKLEPNEAEFLTDVLLRALAGKDDYAFFWNLEEGEVASEVISKFMKVAQQLGIRLQVRNHRKTNRFQFLFPENIQQENNSMGAVLKALGQRQLPSSIITLCRKTHLDQKTIEKVLQKLSQVGWVAEAENSKKFQLLKYLWIDHE